MRILELQPHPFHEMMYRSSGRGGQERQLTLPFYRVRVDVMPDGVEAFAAVSDLQGREIDRARNRLVGEAVADELQLLQELEEIPPLGLILLAGDFYDYPDCRKLGGTGDVTAVWQAFAQITAEVLGVLGNHDLIAAQMLPENTAILDGEVKNVGGLRVGGVSGIIGRVDKNQRKTETQFRQMLRTVITDKTDVVLLHQGPDDPANEQIGEPLIRAFLEQKGSSLVLFGHCHWSVPLVELGKHQALNADNRLYIFSK